MEPLEPLVSPFGDIGCILVASYLLFFSLSEGSMLLPDTHLFFLVYKLVFS